MSDRNERLNRERILVVIASYGQKNLRYLNEIIGLYRSLPWPIDVVLVAEERKQLSNEVEQIIGLPSADPHSLPFAHKQIFADRAGAYDLFVYSEDDIKVSERNIEAYLRITKELQTDEVAGFVRFEVNAREQVFMPDAHWEYHWDPKSIARRGTHTVAQFTNLHTGFYILTQAQLRKALDSGRFLCQPYRGPYGMLESAATDPFTRCELKKVICISELDAFLVHHMSNRYAGVVGIPMDCWNEQVETLFEIRDGRHPASCLCPTAARILPSRFSKSYYEDSNQEVLSMLPEHAETILSVGCGWGKTELELIGRGLQVTALPLDSVIGAVAARRGVNVRYGSLPESIAALAGSSFDCILISNLLHLLPEPGRTLTQLKELLAPKGTLVASGPNIHSGPVRLKAALKRGEYAQLNDVKQSGVSKIGMRWVKQFFKQIGLRPVSSKWFDWTSDRSLPAWLQGVPTGLLARHWVVTAALGSA